MATTMPSSLRIAQEATLQPITEIAAAAGLLPDEIDPYGRYKGKVSLSVLDRLADRPDGKLINVTAITPTKAGEGKTTTSVSLTQGLGHIGKKVALCLREASLGPVFGIKGGAAGGGYTQVVPMEDMNLHFTGDIHAIGAANNLLAAMLEAHLMHGNELDIDPLSVSWRRCMDINDRSLRDIVVGLGGKANGSPRQTGFDITAASEVMAIVASPRDLRTCAVAWARSRSRDNRDGDPVTAEQLRRRRLDDRAAEGDDQAEPRADARGPAGVRPLRPVRQHRARQQLSRRRSGRAQAGRLRRHRERLRLRHGHGEVLRHRLPARRHPARRRRPRRHGQGAEASRGRAGRRPGRDRDRRSEHGRHLANIRGVRPERGRRGEQVPRRHRRRSRARAQARARARRLRVRGERRLHARRRRRRGARRSRCRRRPTSRTASSSPIRWTRRSRRRSRRSPSASTAQTGSRSCPPRVPR